MKNKLNQLAFLSFYPLFLCFSVVSTIFLTGVKEANAGCGPLGIFPCNPTLRVRSAPQELNPTYNIYVRNMCSSTVSVVIGTYQPEYRDPKYNTGNYSKLAVVYNPWKTSGYYNIDSGQTSVLASGQTNSQFYIYAQSGDYVFFSGDKKEYFNDRYIDMKLVNVGDISKDFSVNLCGN